VVQQTSVSSSAVSSRRSWRADFGRLFGASVLAQLLPFLLLPWLTRHYAAEDIGRWLVFAAVASNLATVACGRYEYALVLPRQAAVARWGLRACLALALGLALAVAVLVAAAGLAAAEGWSPPGFAGLGLSWVWLVPAVAAAGASQALALWLNRCTSYAAIGQARVLAACLLAAAQWGLFFAPVAGTTALLLAQVLAGMAGALWLARHAGWPRPWVPRRQWPRLRALAWRHRQFPLVNAPHAFVNALQDTLVLGLVMAWEGPAAAGAFGLMLRVVMAPVSLVAGAWSEVLLGRLAARQRAGEALAPVVARSLRQLAGAGAVLAVAVLALAPWAFGLLLGEAWQEAGMWAAFLAPYAAGRLVVAPLTVLPMLRGRQSTAFAFSACGNLLHVGALALGLALVSVWPPAGGLLPGGSLAVACALVSLVMGGYFLVFGRWLWWLAAQEQP